MWDENGKWETPNQTAERVGPMLKEIAEESKRMTDTNVKGEKTEQILLTGLTRKDMENLNLVASYYPRIKNYGVLIRTVLRDRAKALPKEQQDTLF